MPVDITEYADAINNALADGTFCVVATNGADGVPNVGFKGSVMVFDADHLAYWERTRGAHHANLQRSPGVAVLYFNRERGRHLRFYGRAEVHEDGPIRDEIMARTVSAELERDPERAGAGVLIRVDTVEDAYAGRTQRREQEAV